MVATGSGVPALAYEHPVAPDDRAHQRVRAHRVTPALGEVAGEIHERIPCQAFLSPIRTLTVGAGIRPVGLHRLNLRAHTREARGLPEEDAFRGITAGAGISPAPESYVGSYTITGAFLQGSISACQRAARLRQAGFQHVALTGDLSAGDAT